MISPIVCKKGALTFQYYRHYRFFFIHLVGNETATVKSSTVEVVGIFEIQETTRGWPFI